MDGSLAPFFNFQINSLFLTQELSGEKKVFFTLLSMSHYIFFMLLL